MDIQVVNPSKVNQIGYESGTTDKSIDRRLGDPKRLVSEAKAAKARSAL